ncbi:MAG: response regulator [Alphaproteobacteria bacterium]
MNQMAMNHMALHVVHDPAPAKGRRSVIVVDDDPLQRRQLMDCLSDLGIEVLQEEEGSSALATIQRVHPAVVIMDVRMPVLDGIAAAQAIPAFGYHPKIILMTGDPDSLYRANTSKLDVFAVIEKPIPLRTLSRFVLKALE